MKDVKKSSNPFSYIFNIVTMLIVAAIVTGCVFSLMSLVSPKAEAQTLEPPAVMESLQVTGGEMPTLRYDEQVALQAAIDKSEAADTVVEGVAVDADGVEEDPQRVCNIFVKGESRWDFDILLTTAEKYGCKVSVDPSPIVQ